MKCLRFLLIYVDCWKITAILPDFMHRTFFVLILVARTTFLLALCLFFAKNVIKVFNCMVCVLLKLNLKNNLNLFPIARTSEKGGRYRYSFICQGTSTRRQRSDLFGLRVKLPPLRVKLPPVTTSLV